MTDQQKTQEEIGKNLRNLGYYVKLEKRILAERKRKIDAFARKGNFSVGIEIDHSQTRKKLIDKLSTLKLEFGILNSPSGCQVNDEF